MAFMFTLGWRFLARSLVADAATALQAAIAGPGGSKWLADKSSISVSNVYVIKHRVAAMLKEEVTRLEQNPL